MTEQTTKISDLLAMPVGQGTGGYTLHVKTYKKRWPKANPIWQQVICQDETGEIPVDVKIGSNKLLSPEFHVVVGEIQNAEYLGKDRNKLVVHEYREETQIADEWMEQADKVFAGEMKEVRGKCRYGISRSFIEAGAFGSVRTKLGEHSTKAPSPMDKVIINEWVEFIVTGE